MPILIHYIENFASKNWKFSAQKTVRRGGSNEYPQTMFLVEIRKIMYTLENPSFTT